MSYGRPHLRLLTYLDSINWTAGDVDEWLSREFGKSTVENLTEKEAKEALDIMKLAWKKAKG